LYALTDGIVTFQQRANKRSFVHVKPIAAA
jgi:ribosomal protein L27